MSEPDVYEQFQVDPKEWWRAVRRMEKRYAYRIGTLTMRWNRLHYFLIAFAARIPAGHTHKEMIRLGAIPNNERVREAIRLFSSLSDVAQRATQFHGLLNYIDLSGRIPPQHPAAVLDFLADKANIPCILAAEVSHVRFGARQPAIAVKVVARVLSASKAWIQFEKSYGEDFISLPQNAEALDAALHTLKTRGDELISELSKYCTLRLLSAQDFEDIESQRRSSATSRFEQHLCCRRCALFARCWPDGGATLPCKVD